MGTGHQIARILNQFKPVIELVVAGCAGKDDALAQLGELFKSWRAERPDFVEIIERILEGERDEEDLIESINYEAAAVIRAILARLRGEDPYPQSAPEPEAEGTEQPGITEQQAQLALAAALPAIHPEARAQVEPMLDQFKQAGFTAFAAVLPRIWNGERDPAALCANLDEDDTATVHLVLHLIAHPEELQKMMGG
jgi:hypothetical protein